MTDQKQDSTAKTIHTYRVLDWEKHFEGAKSKTYNNKTACQMPTKHGLGFRLLIGGKSGPAKFGAWCALLQVLSRHEKTRQGWLTQDGSRLGEPLTPKYLEVLTGIPEKLFFDMLQAVAGKQIGWVKDTIRIVEGECEDTLVPLDLDLDLDLDPDSDPKAQAPVKNPYGDLKKVLLSDAEYSKLEKLHGAEWLAYAIETLDGYIAQSAKNANKYVDHYAVMKRGSWVERKVDEEMDRRQIAEARKTSARSGYKKQDDPTPTDQYTGIIA